MRHLAEGDDVAAHPKDSPKSEHAGGQPSDKRTSAQQNAAAQSRTRDLVEDLPRIPQPAVQPVSIESNSQIQALPASAVENGSPCTDAYCKQLHRVADGANLKRTLGVYEPGRTPTRETNFLKNLAYDQLHIWTSPFKLRDGDATWAIPLGIVTGSLIATDRDISKQLDNPGRIDTSKKLSNYGLYSFIAAGAGMYGLGLISHNDHQRETGLLSGEAFINATIVAEALKTIIGRERPFEGDHFGHIGRGGSSFPSGHAIDSWAVASVLAREYPNPFMQIAAYGLASTVSIARITAQQHYASDVLVGSAFGYFIGQKIYRDHHNPELPGAEYGTFVRERSRGAEQSGSAYVPLESWVYSVIDRLAALGFLHSNFDSERPYTRLECSRLASEAAGNADLFDASPSVRSMIDELQREFAPESEVWAGNSDNRDFKFESVYSRATEISGPVLADGYHFGQTLYNDYGRPYGRGFNSITGFSARANSGPMMFYFRGEYQHAPGNPTYTPAQQTLIAPFDFGTPILTQPSPAVDRFQILDAYMGLNLGGNQLTLGQQSLWWGPGNAGPFLFSNNSEPLNMVRLSRVSPVVLPSIFKYLGPMRYEVFLGQTDGYHFVRANNVSYGPHLGTQPFVQGQRFTFKPTKDLEFGFSKTGVFGGTGNPLTFHQLVRATFSVGNTAQGTAPGSPGDPGDRRSGFDLTYRIPKLRDWLTYYLEQFSEDEVSPIVFPRRSAMHTGIYMPKLPMLHNVDLRVEGVYTDIPNFGRNELPGFFYFNGAFLDGYTKNGDLIGSWIGRDGRGIWASSTWWLSPKTKVQLGYREAVADRQFIEGGRYQDFSLNTTFQLNRDLIWSGMLQHENWRFPALLNGPQNNFTTSMQITYSPSWHKAD